MDQTKVLLYVESRYKVNRKRMKRTVLSVLKEQGVQAPSEISVAIIGDRKMKILNKKYRNLDKTTNVLSFPLAEGDSTHLPASTLHLGDVVISYPQVIAEAAAEDMMVDDKVEELLRHGLLHLLGIHH